MATKVHFASHSPIHSNASTLGQVEPEIEPPTFRFVDEPLSHLHPVRKLKTGILNQLDKKVTKRECGIQSIF